MKRFFLKLILELIHLVPIRLRKILFAPFYYIFHSYKYNFNIAQLVEITRHLQASLTVPGNIVEIGCANGRTTVFLNHYLDSRKEETGNKEYICIDTFSGFIKSDVQVEVKKRGKEKRMYKNVFVFNSRRWFDKTMKQNGVTRTVSIRADINQFDFQILAEKGGVSFCLLDVDLYQPILHSLRKLYPLLSSGGVIVVDDCDSNDSRWDGAYAAYIEFTSETDLPVIIVEGKLGIIRKA